MWNWLKMWLERLWYNFTYIIPFQTSISLWMTTIILAFLNLDHAQTMSIKKNSSVYHHVQCLFHHSLKISIKCTLSFILNWKFEVLTKLILLWNCLLLSTRQLSFVLHQPRCPISCNSKFQNILTTYMIIEMTEASKVESWTTS